MGVVELEMRVVDELVEELLVDCVVMDDVEMVVVVATPFVLGSGGAVSGVGYTTRLFD
jgi:hypothetical protein